MMLIRKAYKFRLYPTEEQKILLAKSSGCVRLVWNKSLALQKERLDKKEKLFTYTELAHKIVEWKKEDSTSFLKEPPSQPLQQTLKDLDRALRSGLLKEKGMPKFKKKNQGQDGIKLPQGFCFENKKLFVPKVGLLKVKMGREVKGAMKNLTIVKEAGCWYASIQVEQETKPPLHPYPTSTVGIDLGIKQFATLSHGHVIEPISIYRAYEKKLSHWQQKLSRRKKDSTGWHQAKQRLQNLHEKIRRIRQDYLHKASTWITQNHGIIVLEELKVSCMSKSAKGTLENPGKNVRAKSGLNKSILDQGWYEFRRQLTYKQDWSGGVVHLVAPHYTSQRCHECGHIESANRVSQSDFQCVSCGHKANADENAAKNIAYKALGHRESASESNLTGGRKLEPRRKQKVVLSTISEYSSLALS